MSKDNDGHHFTKADRLNESAAVKKLQQEVHQIDVVQVLQDLMELVLKHLCLKDLSNVTLVCKSWHYAVLRERRKRYYLQPLILPSQINLANALYVIPSVSLLLFDWTLEKSLSLPTYDSPFLSLLPDPVDELLKDIMKQVPNDKIVFKVEELCSQELTNKFDVLGWFLPSVVREVRVRVSYFPKMDLSEPKHILVPRLAEELGLNDCEYSKATIIMLSLSFFMDYESISELGKQAKQNGKEITFASIFGSTLLINSNWRLKTAVLLSISGSRVDSWSTFIHFTAGLDQIKRKLQKLKEKVRRKRFSIGMLYAPIVRLNVGNSEALMQILNDIFPDTRFTGFFLHSKRISDEFFPIVESDEFDEKNVFNQAFIRHLTHYASIIIITYD